jgi:hypothetical protein
MARSIGQIFGTTVAQRILIAVKVGTMLLLAQASASFGQTHASVKKFCSYYGERIATDQYLFPPDDAAITAVARIVTRAGHMNNFILYSANVPNAVATMLGNRRAILYSQDFMVHLQQNDWMRLSILAHEIAHHLHGDPLGAASASDTREMESQADRYSGFILQQLGASLDDVQAAIKAISSEQGTALHPPKSVRLVAVTNGWISAKEQGEKAKTLKSTKDKPEAPTPQKRVTEAVAPPKSNDPTPDFVAEISMNNDSSRYFLNRTGTIMGVTPFPSKSIVYGRQLPSANPKWAWVMQTPNGNFPVDPKGIVWSQTKQGVFTAVGKVASMPKA